MIKKRETALKAIENGNAKLHLWSDELLKDDDLVIAGMKADPCFVNGTFVPDYRFSSSLSDKVKLEAVEINDDYFYWLPKDMLTYEYCLEKVRKNGDLLWWIKEWRFNEFLTEEMYTAAIESGIYCISDVPDKFLTEDVYIQGVKLGSDINPLTCIRKSDRTPRVALEAVKADARNILALPEEMVVEALSKLID